VANRETERKTRRFFEMILKRSEEAKKHPREANSSRRKRIGFLPRTALRLLKDKTTTTEKGKRQKRVNARK